MSNAKALEKGQAMDRLFTVVCSMILVSLGCASEERASGTWPLKLEGIVAPVGEVDMGEPLNVFVRWQPRGIDGLAAATPAGQVIDIAVVEVALPAPFTLELVQLPEDQRVFEDTLTRNDGRDAPRWVIGEIFAAPDPGRLRPDAGPVGYAESHFVLYVDRDVEPGTPAHRALGALYAKGFHLVQSVGGATGRFEAAPDDEVVIRIAQR